MLAQAVESFFNTNQKYKENIDSGSFLLGVMAGLESLISVAILAAVFTFVVVAGTHFNFPEDENKS